jgi:quercetin dioxygenase-like cupin family protein
MAYHRLPFASTPWTPGTHPLERKKAATAGATLIEFAPGFADPNWCERAHVAYVLSGTLRLEVEGRTEEIGAGDGFITERGTRHRASNPGPTPVRLFVVTVE